MAWKILRHFDDRAELQRQDHNLLEAAREWDTSEAPPFLPELTELKNRLLDSLASGVGVARNPTVNLRVAGLMGEMAEQLEEKARGSVDDAPILVVEEFLADLKNDPQGIKGAVEHYTRVVAATCQQAVGYRMAELMDEDLFFESVIVDEAARSNPLDLFIPMSLASRRVILVGDHRQLPHLLEPDVERELEASVHEETSKAIRESLFERLFGQVKRLEELDGIKRWVTLDTQYRMHHRLAAFVSRVFYEPHGESFRSVEDEPSSSAFDHNLGGDYEGRLAVWKNIPLSKGAEERVGFSWRRVEEAKWIASQVHQVMAEAPNLSIGVITFYKEQEKAIMGEMLKKGLASRDEAEGIVISEHLRQTRNEQGEEIERLRVGTVDAFQGKEFDVVFLSVTRSNSLKSEDSTTARRKYGHLLLENRLCVSLSRQRRLLIVVGDKRMAEGDVARQQVPGLWALGELCDGPDGGVI